MIRQTIHISPYGWVAHIFYAVDCYYIDEIIDKMSDIGCDDEMLERAYNSMKRCNLDTGITYSNFRQRESVMVISITSSPDEFQNSYDHEKGHLCKHIIQAVGIDPFGEEAEYLSGQVGQKMFPVAKQFLCEHCRRNINCG